MNSNQEVFLLDTNSFTTPYRVFYAFDIVPAYWNELINHINSGRIVVLDIVKSEIDAGNDDLKKWVANAVNLKVIPRVTSSTISNYQAVLQYVSGCGLYKPSALSAWAPGTVADPWLIASAKANGYTLVTQEVGSNGLSTKNPNKYAKIPDVANHFGVKTINVFDMMRELEIVIN